MNETNHTKSKEIFNRFMMHLNNGCKGNKTLAIHEIKREFHLQSVDARFFIAEGKRIQKEEEKKRQGVLF